MGRRCRPPATLAVAVVRKADPAGAAAVSGTADPGAMVPRDYLTFGGYIAVFIAFFYAVAAGLELLTPA